jgi:hypothetical protein
MAAEPELTRVTLAPVPVMVVAEPGEPGVSAKRAFERLESALPTLRGRRFYGYYDPPANAYRACVAVVDDAEPERVGLARDVLPGGTYLRCRIRGEPPEVYARIGPSFDALQVAAGPLLDRTRPFIEYYRRREEVDLFVPVRAEAS